MKIAIIVVRSLMGLLFLMSSIGYFFDLFPKPVLEGALLTFNQGVEASGYLMALIKGTELVCGLAFITARFVRLATVAIFPVVVNIVLVHIMIAPEGIPVAAFLLLGNLFLAYHYRKDYAPMLVAK